MGGFVILGIVLALASLVYVSPFPGPVQRHYQIGGRPPPSSYSLR